MQNIYIFPGLAVNEAEVVSVTAAWAVIKAAVKQTFTDDMTVKELALEVAPLFPGCGKHRCAIVYPGRRAVNFIRDTRILKQFDKLPLRNLRDGIAAEENGDALKTHHIDQFPISRNNRAVGGDRDLSQLFTGDGSKHILQIWI